MYTIICALIHKIHEHAFNYTFNHRNAWVIKFNIITSKAELRFGKMYQDML